QRYMQAPYFSRPAPKSLDRGDFLLDDAEGLELADGARTLARVSAEAIAKALDHLPATPVLWIVSGGGRKNPSIVADLQEIVVPAKVILSEDAGLDGD